MSRLRPFQQECWPTVIANDPTVIAREISTVLTQELQDTRPENQDDVKIAGLWTSNNDARNYAFLGDPAVRLAAGEVGTPKPERESLGEIVTQVPELVVSYAAGFQPDVVSRAFTSESAPVVLAPVAPSEESFGLFSRETKTDEDGVVVETKGVALSGALREFLDKLGTYMSNALDDATSLEVLTYVREDLGTVTYEKGKFTGSAHLRALTRVNDRRGHAGLRSAE